MSTNPQPAMLVDTTRAISTTTSPALVVPMPQQSNPSIIVPGGKWYMVYVPPGGTLPMVPLPTPPVPTATTSSTTGVAVEEATSSVGPPSMPENVPTTSNNEPPKQKRGRGAGKSRREWYSRRNRQATAPPPNANFYRPQPKRCSCNFKCAEGYQPRSFCPGGFH